MNIEKTNRDSASIKLEYKILLKSNTTQLGSYLFLQLSQPRLPEFENSDKRHFPLRLSYPVNYIDTTIVDIPNKYKPGNNTDENFKNQYGMVKVSYTIHNNKIEVDRNILINSGEYSIEEYKGFYQFISKSNKAISSPISFTKYE